MSNAVSIEAVNLPEVRRAVKAIGKDAEKYVAKRIRPAAEVVQKEIMARTPVYTPDEGMKGSYGRGQRARTGVQYFIRNKVVNVRNVRHIPGLLKRSTKFSILQHGMEARIYNTARASAYLSHRPGKSSETKGYRYGKRLEFDPVYGGKYRFFYPGYEASKGKAQHMLSQVIVDLANEFNRSD